MVPQENNSQDPDLQEPDRALALHYDELRQLARQRLRRMPLDSLQPAELVHEMYLRMATRGHLEAQNRYHYFSLAARAMQDVLIERARAATARKRGGGLTDITLSSAIVAVTEDPTELLALHGALETLHREDPLSADVVRLRFFVGFTGDETAEALGISPSTVDRRWLYARAWLHEAIYGDGDQPR